MIFEKWQKNRALVEQAGVRAIEAARRAGVAAYYSDPRLGDGLVRELPDGSRQLIKVVDGKDVPIRSLVPRS